MVMSGGESLLQKCLTGITGQKDDIGSYIIYTRGTKLHAKLYQNEKIKFSVNYLTKPASVLFCVKDFYHFGVFAAWKKRGDHNCQEYFVYKSALVDMENSETDNFCEIPIDLDSGENVFLFRGEEGVKEFLQQKLLPQIASITVSNK